MGAEDVLHPTALGAFGKDEAEEFLKVLLGDGSSPPLLERRGKSPLPTNEGERDRVRVMEDDLHALKQLILTKTEGTPFFMEEVVQTLAEEGALIANVGTISSRNTC